MATSRRRAGQSGAGKKKNNVILDTSGFEGMLMELESMGANLDHIVSQTLGEAAKRIESDMRAAVVPGKMPARGKFWTGTTERSVVHDTTVRKDGNLYWVPVGFDFDLPGAGGFLIVGTPYMEPVPELYRMFQQKSYMREIQNDLWESVEKHLEIARKAYRNVST